MRDLRFPFFLGLFVFLICVNSAIAEDDVVEDESNVIIDVILDRDALVLDCNGQGYVHGEARRWC